jgi:hypothetical protein
LIVSEILVSNIDVIKNDWPRSLGKKLNISPGLPHGINIFQRKIPFLVNFGGPWKGKGWYTYSIAIWSILRPFGIFYGHLIGNLVTIWYIFPLFGILLLRKIWQPCIPRQKTNISRSKSSGETFQRFRGKSWNHVV